jgi:hypothetical protein
MILTLGVIGGNNKYYWNFTRAKELKWQQIFTKIFNSQPGCHQFLIAFWNA